eukprot:symbB.v1.2.012049.t1/scaffold817.1/size160046/8
MQDHSGRLAGEETTRAELQEQFQQSCEAAEAAAQRAQHLASEAASKAREVASEVMSSMEESLSERLKVLSEEGRQRALNLEDQFKDTNHRISLQAGLWGVSSWHLMELFFCQGVRSEAEQRAHCPG